MSKIFKRLCIILFLFFITGFLMFKCSDKIKSYASDIKLLSYFNSNNVEEKNLSEAVNTMYVTMLDEKSRVIATTNPDIEVNSNYVYSETQEPRLRPNTNSQYYILFEISDTNDENGYTKLEDNVIYTMDLPDYIVPNSSYDDGVTIMNKCYNFSTKGKSKACGGIYKDNNKYKFKVKFNNVLNKKKVKTSYQFSTKLNKTLDDIIFNIKTIDFGLPGYLQLFMKKEEIVEQASNFNLSVESNGWSVNTQNYAIWTTKILDNKESKSMNGSLIINFGDFIGLSLDQNNWFDKLKIYADGVELYSSRNGQYTNGYYDSSSRTNIYATVSMIDSEDLYVDNNRHPSTSIPFSYLLKSFKIDFNNYNSLAIEGVTEWKIVVNARDYSVCDSSLLNYFNIGATFIDNSNINDRYVASSTISKNYSKPSVTVESEKKSLNNYGYPSSIKYTAHVTPTNSNVLKISNIPNYYNNSGIYYYLDHSAFDYTSNSISPLYFSINGRRVSFYFTDTSSSSSINFFDTPAFIPYSNPALNIQMKNSADSFNLSDIYLVYKSDITNDDGEYYWIVLSRSTYSKATGSPSYLSNGRSQFLENTPNRYDLYEPGTWTIYLYNASLASVDINYTSNIDAVNYIDKTFGINNNKYILNRFDVGINNNSISSSSVAQTNLDDYQHIKAIGEWKDSNTIKWTVEVDFLSMGIYPYSIYNYDLIVYTPTNMYIPSSSTVNLCTSGSHSSANATYCNSETPLGTFNSFSYPSYDLLSERVSVTYNKYNTSTLYNKSFVDGNLVLTFETKITSLTNESNAHSNESIYVQLSANKFNNYSTSGLSLRDINVFAKTAVEIPTIDKKYRYSSLYNNNISHEWEVTSNLYDSTVRSYSDMFFPGVSSYPFKDDFPLFFYGNYSFSDSFEINNDVDYNVAKNTFLESVSFELYSMEGRVSFGGNLSNFKYGGSESYYKEVSYGTNSNIKFKITSVDSSKSPNMASGIVFGIEGIKRGEYVRIIYRLKTNMEDALRDIKSSNSNLNVNSLNGIEVNLHNKARLLGGGESSQQTLNSNRYVSVPYKYYFLADLTVNKNIENTSDNIYKNDTKHNSTIATIGFSPTSSLDLTEFIDGVSNLEYNTTTKSYDKKDFSTNIENLKTIRKNILLSNIVIKTKSHIYGEYSTIYSDGEFINSYLGSSLIIDDTSNELFKLHLVRSDGNNIPTYTDVMITYDMSFNPDNYRLNEYYDGGKLYISTNAEAIRDYDSNSIINSTQGINSKKVKTGKMSSRDGNYENRIDSDNNLLIVYASNGAGSIGSDYLEPPKINKVKDNNVSDIYSNKWIINYNINSTGKNENANIDFSDVFDFKINGDSTHNSEIISTLKKYIKYKNIKVYYNGKNTSMESEPIYTYDDILTGNINISTLDVTGNIEFHSNSFSMNLYNFNYEDKIIITYETDIDFESALLEMIDKNYIDSNFNLTDTNEKIDVSYRNLALDNNYNEGIVESSYSSIAVSSVVPVIKKNYKDINNDEITWELSFKTGLNSDKIDVVDNLKVISNNIKELIEKSLVFKDLKIKIGDDVVYSNGEFIEPWNDNITINNNNLGYEFKFKDTSSNSFIGDNNIIIITYKTCIDDSKYDGKSKGLFSLENTAIVKKNGYENDDKVTVSDINYDFPVELNKEFIGNNVDLSETKWKIELNTGKINRKDIRISDTAILGSNFSKYLSLSNLNIKINDEVIYDSDSSSNNMNNIKIIDKDGNDIEYNVNGKYEFDILFYNLEKMSNVVIEYTLKIDKDEYLINNEITDNELLINNSATVTSDDDIDITKTSIGSSKILSKLTKKYDFLGYDNNDNPIIRWYVDINLLSDYDLDSIRDKEIIITDNLSEILELTGDVKLNYRIVTGNNIDVGSNIDSSKYELDTEDNKVKVKILDVDDVNNFRISFETICLASISDIENYVTLSVNDEINEIKSSGNTLIFSPYVSGIISSLETLNYNVIGKKLYDGNICSDPYMFEIIEINENGEEIENGFRSINSNGENGVITFNSLLFEEEGFYYYKIREIQGDNINIIYDNTEYILRIKTIENRGSIVIEDIKLINSDKDEIVFNNKTKPKEENKTIIDIITNPKTKRTLFIIILFIPIMGYYLLKKKIKK